MKLRTHIAFGFLFGILFYYFFGFGFEFVLLTGFVAFLPDIDLTMQKDWSLGNRHRKFGHNIWFMLGVGLIGFVGFRSPVLFLGIVVGILSHYVADSLTVSGIRWIYPLGEKGGKFHISGPFSMSDKNNRRREKIIQSVLFGLTGFLFLIKQIEIKPFSTEGLISLGTLLLVGYMMMKLFDKTLEKIIKTLNL